jgi:RNA polymerase sigma-70 factor (ECF subfamily)
MALEPSGDTTGATRALHAERARLVRLCARLTGDPDAAEDLAQDALVEAWRHEHALRDPAKRGPWLAGIARNVCLRWARQRTRATTPLVQRLADRRGPVWTPDDEWSIDPFDAEIELERHELADLLDRALGLLPPETRAVLVARYIEESPHAEIAARLGVTEAAAKMRCVRGLEAVREQLRAEGIEP